MKYLVLLMISILFVSCFGRPPRSRPSVEFENSLGNNFTTTVEPEPITRPSGVVYMQPGYCACQDAKPTILGNCESYCNGKGSTTEEILYIDFKVSEELALNQLQDFNGWCNQELVDPETNEPVEGGANPSCQMEFKDDTGNIEYLQISHTPGTTQVKTILSSTNLQYDKTYRVTIVENSSGARSNTVQIRRIKEQITSPIDTPLAVTPITQYTCFGRIVTESGDDDNPTEFYDGAFRMHFYFIPDNRPDPIPPGINNFFCHDIFDPEKGRTDSEIYDRLEQIPGAFSLWDKYDPRFYDNFDDGEDAKDIHKLIQQSVVNQGYSMDNTPKMFFEFTWPGQPEANSSAGNNQGNNLPLGYYMTPWIDQDTLRAYCPTEEHYLSTNPVFTAMRELVGVPTEGLFIAVKPASTIVTSAGVEETPIDFILIREGLAEQIWFYIENQQYIRPTDDTIRGKKVQFYWPPAIDSPYVKKSHQALYTIYSVDEIRQINSDVQDSGSSSGTGENSQYPPHDKRIGCIPKSNDIF
jgi:hypothetical protein